MPEADGPSLKFLVTEGGDEVVARVLAGPSYERMRYSGTIAVPSGLFERVVDALTLAAYDGGFRVYCAPDDEMREQ